MVCSSYGLTSNDILLALQVTHTAADEYNTKKPRKMNDNHIVSQWKGKLIAEFWKIVNVIEIFPGLCKHYFVILLEVYVIGTLMI